MKNLPIKAKISRILSWLWLHNLIPGSSRHVEYVTSGSCGRHPPDTELRLCCLLASLYPGLLSLCDIQLRSPLLALLYLAASRFVVRASALTRAGCAALLPVSKLAAASRICTACGGCCRHLSCHAALTWGQRLLRAKGIPAKRTLMHLGCVCVYMHLFIYLRCSNWVPLGSCNVTKSGQCFHGAEGMLVKLRSSSAWMEILDLEWIEVGNSIWAWK